MRFVVGLLATMLLVATQAPASAGESDIAAARRRANAAAAELSRANSELEQLEDDVARLQREADAAGAQVRELRAAVQHLAVQQYMEGGQQDLAILMAGGDLNQTARARALVQIIANADTDAIDEYRAAKAVAEETHAVLEQRLGAQRTAVAELRERTAELEAELRRMQQEQAARERAAAAAAARARARASASRAAASAPAALSAAPIASGSWICPVQGPVAFSNDYGQPRSGGRSHEGNDMFAPYGTPVVASVGGTVRLYNSGLGGLSYFLYGDDGTTYFGTHLSRFGNGGRVAAGRVVGYVGTSGNAAGTSPHLHFEIHPGGGGPVNPYPTISRYC